MGLVVKVDGVEQPSGESKPQEVQMTHEGTKLTKIETDAMAKRLWEVINENTELKQQLYMAEHRLEQIKRIVAE